jgi:hypothetical protein
MPLAGRRLALAEAPQKAWSWTGVKRGNPAFNLPLRIVWRGESYEGVLSCTKTALYCSEQNRVSVGKQLVLLLENQFQPPKPQTKFSHLSISQLSFCLDGFNRSGLHISICRPNFLINKCLIFEKLLKPLLFFRLPQQSHECYGEKSYGSLLWSLRVL